MHANVKDLTKRTFGMLLVIGPAPRPEGSKGRGKHWECICECLGGVVVRSDSLIQGWTTSCGCKSPKSTHARSFIKPRRPKSTISEQPSKGCSITSHTHITNMPEKNTTSTDTVGVKFEDLKALRQRFDGLSADYFHPATQKCIEWLDAEIAKGEPRTVKGETLRDQTARFTGIPMLQPGEPAHSGPVLDLRPREHSHYFKDVSHLTEVDVYRVLDLFCVTDQAIGHALKKLLVIGQRGVKDFDKDLKEAIDSLKRKQAMLMEDANKALLKARGCA